MTSRCSGNVTWRYMHMWTDVLSRGVRSRAERNGLKSMAIAVQKYWKLSDSLLESRIFNIAEIWKSNYSQIKASFNLQSNPFPRVLVASSNNVATLTSLNIRRASGSSSSLSSLPLSPPPHQSPVESHDRNRFSRLSANSWHKTKGLAIRTKNGTEPVVVVHLIYILV